MDYDFDEFGRPKRVTLEPNHPELSSRVTYQYDVYGQVEKSTAYALGETPRPTYYYYDPLEHIFQEQVQDALGHTTTTVFHPAFGVPVVVQDPNLVTARAQVDGFGRTVAIRDILDHPTTVARVADERFGPGLVTGIVTTTTASNGGASVSYSDERGRVTETAIRGSGGQWIHERIERSMFGHVLSRSRPGFSAPSPHAYRVTSDSLGRPLVLTDPDGATTILSHAPFFAEMIDPAGRQSYLAFDREDRVIESGNLVPNSQPWVPPSVVRTTYEYGAWDRLRFVTDDHQNVSEANYDKLGRRVFQSDPDAGVTTTAYNGFGELMSETTALGTTTWLHDVLGRVTTRIDGEGPTLFVWDALPMALGKVIASVSPDGTMTQHTYDALGRPEISRWTIGGDIYEVETTYDADGRVREVLYPEVPGRERFRLGRTYDGAGNLSVLVEGIDAKDPRDIFRVLGLSEDLRVEDGRFGNGVETHRDYDPITGRLVHVTTGESVDLALHYGVDGALDSRHDTILGRSEHYQYDALGRLRQWTLAPGISALPSSSSIVTSYQYDTIGNLTAVLRDGVNEETHTPGAQGHPHALASIVPGPAGNGAPASYQYDARGRQVAGGGRTIPSYTGIDLPRTICSPSCLPSTTTQLSYDAAGQRVRKSGALSDTVYVGELYERRTVNQQVTHVFHVSLDGVPVADVIYDEGSQQDHTLYIETDALGSTTAVLDDDGAVIARPFYDPYGRPVNQAGKAAWGPSSEVSRGYTGHLRDDELALIPMRGRVYDPGQRRFLSPDPMVSDPWFGQAYNRYAYALNAPTTRTDPSGLQSRPTENGPDAGGIGFTFNGVFLPGTRDALNPKGAAVHSGVHTDRYYEAVESLLASAKGRDEAIEAMDQIRQALLAGGFP